MLITYLRLVEEFKNNNLENHIDSIKYELINDGNGFKIFCNDWVVFFNEYGTGIYNSLGGGRQDPWTYFKDGEFFTTQGQRPKFVWLAVKRELEQVAREYYDIALKYAVEQKSYEDFKSSLRLK